MSRNANVDVMVTCVCGRGCERQLVEVCRLLYTDSGDVCVCVCVCVCDCECGGSTEMSYVL